MNPDSNPGRLESRSCFSYGVEVGALVADELAVRLGVSVELGVLVGDGVRLGLGVLLGMGVGASPSTINRPTTFHSAPTKIWTSYSPGCQPPIGSEQSVYPNPPVVPSHGAVS